jgi:dolichol-phosphate mannosyltransferase
MENGDGQSGGTGMWHYVTVRHRHNWWMLFKFGLVGGSGYVVNLIVYALALKFGLHYIGAAVVAFAVANLNNYLLNKYYTFPTQATPPLLEYLRFLGVGLISLAFNVAILRVLVEDADVDKLLSQAIAIAVVTPIGFVGNKLWTFGDARRAQK